MLLNWKWKGLGLIEGVMRKSNEIGRNELAKCILRKKGEREKKKTNKQKTNLAIFLVII
jgi:hypothetical protein